MKSYPLRYHAAASFLALTISMACSGPDEQSRSSLSDASVDTHFHDALNDSRGDLDSEPDGSSALDASGEADTIAHDASSCVPRQPSTTLPSGYPSDGWTWHDRGVLLELTGAKPLDGYLAPSAVVHEDVLHLWVTRKEGLQHRILHTSSSDGQTFTQLAQATGLGDDDVIAYPSVLWDGTQWRMWYSSGAIDVATSTDGIQWTVTNERVLKPGGAGEFDSMSVLYPSVVPYDPGYAMVYTGYDGQGFALGLATSTDGVTWTKKGKLLDRGPTSSFYNRSTAQSALWKDKTGWLLWFGGYDTSKTNPGPYRVGLATSPDGTSFQVAGVTLDLGDTGPDAHSTRDPSVIRWHGGWWMAFTGLGTDNRYRIMSASSNTCR